ncbi:hypothetical protein OIU34_26570 [Pararhizobium sp. BT-229]|uniref:hypothetical protein n=1 Tax=Pararhizobium sp. BT-229 TaxID=2986923 RepID=UPI0021F6ACC5|nr:hypothetical protein [Pararhizobium sp. BT-229]MCV9965447.1 hypothetical protein [Pararhizobium sp. BT-229]
MVDIVTPWRKAYRKYASDGIPSTGENEPDKEEILPLGDLLQSGFDRLQADVDGIKVGVKPIVSLDLATTANVVLSGEQTIDGSMTAASKVLVWVNADKKQHGPYLTGAGAWTRLPDFNAGEELLAQQFFIKGGTANGEKTYGLQNTTLPTVGVNDLVYDVVNKPNTAKPSALDALRAKGADVVSASAVDIYAVTGDYINITGTIPLDTLGTAPAGVERKLRFPDGGTINASASIETPDAEDMTIPLKGSVVVTSLGSNVWQVTSFPGDVAAERLERKNLIDAVIDNTGPYKHEFSGEDGFTYAALGETESSVSGMTVLKGDGAGIERAGIDRFLMPGDGDTPAVDITLTTASKDFIPYLAPTLYGIEGEEMSIHLANIVSDRAKASVLRMTLLGASGYQRSSRDQIVFRPDKLGVSANFYLRKIVDDSLKFGDLPVAVKYALLADLTGTSPVICNVGDSILYRGGMAWLKKYLNGFGCTPSFIGTLTGEADAGEAGQLGECKPGHCLGDLTNAFTNRITPLAVGGEAAFLADTIDNKRFKNTMLRPSTGGDAAQDIVNGHVLDFEFWRTRWATDFTTPTLLLNEYGRNDIATLPSQAIYQHFYDNDSLIYRRWHLDYPTAPVVRMLPNCARDSEGDYEWAESYIQAILGMWAARNTAVANGVPVVLVPSWASTTIDGGFDLLGAIEVPEAITGAIVREIADFVHPTGGTEAELWRIATAGVACAVTGKI